MDKFLALCSPIGLFILCAYLIINRFVVKVPDAVAYPVMIISIALMIAGLAYNGWCFGNGTTPFDCLKK